MAAVAFNLCTPTHADAARQRGGAILADTGRQYRVQITLPLTDDTGLLMPGKVVEIPEGQGWRGLTRGLRVSAQLDSAPSVRQTVDIERHGESW